MPAHRRSAPFIAQLVLQYARAEECSIERADRRRSAEAAYGHRAKTGSPRPGFSANLKV